MPGDGPGPSLFQQLEKVLNALESRQKSFTLNFKYYDIGLSAYKKHNNAFPESTSQGIRDSDAAIIGMLSSGLDSVANPVGAMRRELMLYADVRPAKSYPGLWSLKPDIDIVCIRENTEGFLADRNLYKGYGEAMPSEDTVISLRVLTRKACKRIARFSFEFARREGRKKITVVHKANVLHYGCGFFLDIVRETGKDYPDICLEDEYVDSVAHNLITHPEKYDVLLATNMFGDIISDEAAALVSDMVPSINIGDGNAVFIPVSHVVKEDDTKWQSVNPLPVLVCATMMLSHIGLNDASKKLNLSITEAIKNLDFTPEKLMSGLSATRIINEVHSIICR